VVVATLGALARDGKVDASVVQQAIQAYNINPDKSDPAHS
jgi:pyruvate dehydrogenase complex dehydrogenase (E1) component